ncbi:MAG TPA: hypothetical protein VH593_00975, partial [Ktedonobacteraceae bacterium]
MPTTARLVDEITGENIQLAYDDGDPLFCNSPILTDVIDYGFASPRVVQYDIPDANGTTDLTEYHSDKTVSWSGWVVPTLDDPFPAITWDKIRRLCAPNRRPWMYVQENGWDSERRMVIRCDSLTSPLDRNYGAVIVGTVNWKVPSGVMESSILNQQDILLSGGTGGLCVTQTGFCFDQTGCSNFGAGSFGGASIVTNDGTVVTYPIIVFTGPAKNPRVYNPETQLGIYLNATLVPNQQVVIDTLHKTVQEVAQPTPINRLAWWDFTKSSWLTLEAGDNELTYASDDKNGVCTFYWR